MALTKTYLIAYNVVSLILWIHLLARTFAYLDLTDAQSLLTATATLYADVLPWLQLTQTLALLELVHAATGLVRAPLATTAVQIGGKNLVVWLVMSQFPILLTQRASGALGFLGCLLAWGSSEVIRYGFFAAKLLLSDAPSWLKWLRYNAFLVLYPVGLCSEATLVYLSLAVGQQLSTPYKIIAVSGLISYIPAGPYLYMHMLTQRRKA